MWLELQVLAWLVVEEEESEPTPAFGPVSPVPYRAIRSQERGSQQAQEGEAGPGGGVGA
jgi:hypothetical protein